MLALKKGLESSQREKYYTVSSNTLVIGEQAGSTKLGGNPEKSFPSYQTWTF